MNTFDLSLDLDKKSGVTQWVTMRQGDHDGTQLRATIYDHGTQVSDSYTCRVSIRKPTDNEYYRETCSFSGGVAIVTIDEQYAASEAGITYGYFELLQGTAVIASTENFGVRILQSAIDGAIVAPPYDSAIEDALAELDEATGRISQMVVDATAEYLEAHPEITTTVLDNSITDAKLIQKGGILQREQWLETMLPNIPRKATAEADVHSVTDSAGGGPLGIEVYGRSTQDGTPTPDAPVPIVSVEGNLLDPTEAFGGASYYTVNADGSVTVTSNDSRGWASVPTIPLAAGTYTVVIDGNADGQCGIHTVDGSTETGYRIVGSGSFTFTLTSGGGVKLKVLQGTFPRTVHVAVYAGANASPFVPYGGIGLRATGRNLLDLDGLTANTEQGITFTPVFEGGTLKYVSMSGTSTGRAKSRYIQIGSLPSGTYTFGVGSRVANAGAYIRIDGTGGSVRYIDLADGSTTTSRTFTVSDGDVLGFSADVRVSGITLSDLRIYPQLEVGSVAHAYQPYQPYQSVTIPIDLGGRSLRSLPDGTRDEVTVDEWGHAILTQRVGSVTFDGSSDEAWSVTSAGLPYIALGVDAVNNVGVCDHAVQSASTTSAGTFNVYKSSSYASRVYLNVNGGTMTAAEVKAWLAENPTNIIYALAEPVTIDLGQLDPALLPAPDLTAYVVPSASSVLRYGFDVAAAIAEIATS